MKGGGRGNEDRGRQEGRGGGGGGGTITATPNNPKQPQNHHHNNYEQPKHRTPPQIQNARVADFDLGPSVGDIVEATSREPTFAWGGNATVQGVQQGPGLYSIDNHTVSFPCDSLGPAGYYSVRLIAPGLVTESARLIASSLWFKVEWSDEFTLQVNTPSIQPCYSDSSLKVRVAYPYCLGKKEEDKERKQRDKVRVYALYRANVTSANPPIEKSYVSEVPVKARKNSVYFPCEVFNREATEYCFAYVNTAVTNVTSLVRQQCVPYYKPNALRKDGEWGAWSDWTPCTALCDGERGGGGGQRQRHRFCDSPAPRNGGRFCLGSSLEEEACVAPGDGCAVGASQNPPSPASSTPGGSGDPCLCGCTMALLSSSPATITASAADCYGTAVWLLQAPPGQRVVAEVQWAFLRPGGQWLKLRDGNTSAAPLLVLLPTAPPRPTLARPESRRPTHAPPRVSTGSVLLLEFHSDVNTSMASPNPNAWGFLLKASPAESAGVGVGLDVEGAVEGSPRVVVGGGGDGLLEGMHVAAVVFVALLVVAVVVLAAIHWRHYRLYQRARLVPDSPFATPPDSPSKATTTAAGTTVASTLTLSEVISLKSLVLRPCLPVSLPLRRRGAAAAHSPQDTEPLCSTARHSLPNSPFLTRRDATPSTLRRSSSQMSRLLRRGSGPFRRKRRRFASVDELETRCISPIREIQREDEAEGGKEALARREDDEEKYRERCKSLVRRDEPRLTPKLAKERLNLERARRAVLSRSTSAATVRPASSVSDVSSVNGTDTEMEYDYYDYDMDNASAVPGSLFGMDPLLLAWMPPFFTGPDGLTPTSDAIPLEMISLPEVLPSPAEAPQAPPRPAEAPQAPPRPTVLPLPHLNIPINTSPPRDPPMQTSLMSEEANDRVELQPEEEHDSPAAPFDEDSTPTANTCSKILNLDDIQFADDSDSADEL
ncbi:uncharacterized protein LOC126995213 [Eriocheir sinensis]|uniref:uncharacterized protein LOC126995213 n=1 Tax=Eriocheir sinensis TaxID=95602 RepID=UPI0021C6B8A1|nr:uncharacterized protein LOC126995213 [Eriocheir sinensis]XP_050710531.1 uncharacterized protein LOC126995213 [Eriocheir sinensis]XP_050710532.1 uncharacterized protein LOC126995213 [Eriocheir sinensis]XP_050710533.1 uncharacterized protein LOC126995213 [Eriocheir sinensis]XP_050710534.1 uncharacterized protein LOC126995213 [Eriocheir sinensis]XP_050710535.1 uncharacterized protein LOC126995213 [Eriocheir sinensis]XP_050710536.1 uncharacterized protein LOC126995213 [Eriocheir sinensis]XP_0